MTERKPLNYDDLFPERWLHADDLKGKDVTLTISDVYQESLRIPGSRKATDCGVVSFEKTNLEYLLNKTNARFLKARYGKDASKWIGKRVTLRPIDDESGKSRSGFRILFVDTPTPQHIGDTPESHEKAPNSDSQAEYESAAASFQIGPEL
jgi:hypothetical protein